MNSFSHNEDNYLPCHRYRDYSPGDDGFARFQDPETEQWYFSYFRDGEVILRSEGYTSEAGRDNGVESVKNNMASDDNYSIVQQPDGKWVLSLHAANKKEIARTCRFDDEVGARRLLPSAFAARAASMAPGAAAARQTEDDYLTCSEYENHPRHAEHGGFGVFEKDGEYLFVLYHSDGTVRLRSEKYTTEAARDNGIESVLKNMQDDDRYKVVEAVGYYFLVLRAANNKEIAKSCPYKTREEALAHLPSALAALSAARAPQPQAREDDYLACKEYEDHPRSDQYEDFSVFEKNGEYYFALLGDDDKVLLRSEGYTTQEARANGMRSVMKNKTDKDRYKTEEHLGYHFVILTAANNKEIARSCPKDKAAAIALIGLLTGALAAVAVAPLAATPVTTYAAAPPPEKAGGMKWWWWLLPLLLLLLLFLWWRGCSDETPAKTATGPVYASEDECAWAPILFGFDSDTIQLDALSALNEVVSVMKSNTEYRALFIGFSDSQGSVEYNSDLSKRRAEAAKAWVVSRGVDSTRISTNERDENNPVASNQEEAGRRFNRRVVMYVLDAKNRLVCKQIELAIPEQLKE